VPRVFLDNSKTSPRPLDPHRRGPFFGGPSRMDDDLQPLIKIQERLPKPASGGLYRQEQRETLLFWADVLEKQTRELDRVR